MQRSVAKKCQSLCPHFPLKLEARSALVFVLFGRLALAFSKKSFALFEKKLAFEKELQEDGRLL